MPRWPTHPVRTVTLLAVLGGALTGPAALAGPVTAGPVPDPHNRPPLPATAEPARDEPWLGPLTLEVDATDLDHRLYQVRQTLPVRAGPLRLLYPRWLPGNHGPTGEVGRVAGLVVSAGEQRLPWLRDPADPYAFTVQVPEGVSELRLAFQFLSPVSKQDSGRVTMAPALAGVQWNQVLLYPAGHTARALRVQPRLRLPAGWQAATALRTAEGPRAEPDAQGWLRFGEVSLETLVDSPVFAGRHLLRVELDPPGTPQPVTLNLLADEPEQLQATPAQLDAHRRLVQQAQRLFGLRPWRHYDFLLAQSREFGGIGLEHHESSENGVRPGYFKDWDKGLRSRELLPHEFTHAWDGKYRRPADLWTAHYNEPMRNSLLWVYEGQTQFWGHVLAARAGLSTPQQARDRLARTAAGLDQRAGRQWRDLQDTTNEATLGGARRKPWGDWQRGVDYYDEGLLIWLEVDQRLRQLSGGRRSIDDFARAFFGVPDERRPDGSPQPRSYDFDEVVATLQAVQPFDWAGLLRERLDGHGPGAPLQGLALAGWTLVYDDQESPPDEEPAEPGQERGLDLMASLGLRLDGDGAISEVRWQGPAFQAGLAPGWTLVAVHLERYRPERLKAAVRGNRQGQQPLALLLQRGDQFRQVTLDYRDGLRVPHLVRLPGVPDRLTPLYAPRE